MTYERILGHDRQKSILRKATASSRLAHAYLFHGPEGVGKRLLALALVRTLVCRTGDGCGDCASCRRVDHHNHPDLHLLEPADGVIKIDQVRKVQRELSLRPLEATKKVCLIDNAEAMNPSAANALLKTLEEPSGDSLLILLTAHPEGLLPTIRSRCQNLAFGRLPRELLRQALIQQLDIDPVEGDILAALSDGSFHKALGKNRSLYLEERRGLLKRLTALSPGSILPLFQLAEELSQRKDLLSDLLDILRTFFRDLLLFLHGRPAEELVNRDLLEKIQRVAARETPETVLRKLEALFAAGRHLQRNANPQLTLEVLLLRLAV